MGELPPLVRGVVGLLLQLPPIKSAKGSREAAGGGALHWFVCPTIAGASGFNAAPANMSSEPIS